MIKVCPLSRLNDTVEECRAKHVVTLVRDEARLFRPARVEPDNHLWLQMDDITDEIEGMICPREEHVEKLVSFLERWDREQPLVIHCFAGISRSTAAAFIAACALAPQRDEVEIARRLRMASATASPNPRLIALGDSYLGREGRMLRAVDRIGYGLAAYEAEPFTLPVD
jgi:predicted protein tyrosine phosphatase